MAQTNRQNNLLVNQDWKTVYQSFREADFQSYDFETLRKSMIDYLRTYYPEDFNDYTESSEFVALLDLIAFLGQSLAFRADLNARENFFDTAERRDSILKLAKLISYNAKRNTPASGLLKIDSVTTTESVTDSNGLNLRNLVINWNDSVNPDWQEQFTAIINAALVNNQLVGDPGNYKLLGTILTDEYTVNLASGVTPTYSFNALVDGSPMTFEAVSATTVGQDYLYEAEPRPTGRFNVIYRTDNLGNASNNTGFFVMFKQGSLSSIDFNLNQSLPNRVVNINTTNINNTDVWLYSLLTDNTINELWESVPNVAGTNVIYNRNMTNRNLYQVNTRTADQIDLVFGDGAFSNIPQGRFRLYHRVSNGLRYKVTPDEMQGIVIPLTYVSRNGRVETLTLRASLKYTVANADSRESINDIRNKAPQQYYTQNRMITGEDYNLFPFTNFSSILKVKAVNRSSSGTSRYLDVLDTTGKYSSTNVFGSDGYLYQEQTVKSVNFTFNRVSEIQSVIYNMVQPTLTDTEVKQFYYANFTRPALANNLIWNPAFSTIQVSDRGYIATDSADQALGIGLQADTAIHGAGMQHVVVGSLLKFSAGSGNYFNTYNQIISGDPQYRGDRKYIYASVIRVEPGNVIRLNQPVPRGSEFTDVIPVFNNTLPQIAVIDQMVDLIRSYKNFGIRYDVDAESWAIILPQDLNTGAFSETHTGDITGTNKDSSWLMSFVFNGVSYTFAHRALNYVMHSDSQTRFYYDPDVKVYDSRTGNTLYDQISLLRVNETTSSLPSLIQDTLWYVDHEFLKSDGYTDNSRVYVTFPDTNNDGVPDNPDIFQSILDTSESNDRRWVFFREVVDNGTELLRAVDNTTVVTQYGTQNEIQTVEFQNGQLFYVWQADEFFQLVRSGVTDTLVAVTDMIARLGRQDLYFQYRHNAPNDRRIDPSPNNIMDLFILTKQYTEDFLSWIRDTTGSVVAEPQLPLSEELKQAYGSGTNSLENFKALSDTLVYNTGRFKPVFGDKAPPELRATFKVVKNPNTVVSDNDIKTSVIAAINAYFDTENWDFGETFYFSELSTYLHNVLAPNIASIIIVPASTNQIFGELMQINADPDEVIVSAATVDNVEIINSITAQQITRSLL